MGPRLAPAHPRQLQALADDRLARALHRAAADAPAARQVFGVLHPVRVPLEIADQLLGGLTQPRPTRPVPLAEDRPQGRAAFVLEPLPPLPCLILGGSLVFGVQPPRQLGELLRGVVEVQNDYLDAREVLPQPVLQAVAAIGQPDPAVGPIHADVPTRARSSGANSSSGYSPER